MPLRGGTLYIIWRVFKCKFQGQCNIPGTAIY